MSKITSYFALKRKSPEFGDDDIADIVGKKLNRTEAYGVIQNHWRPNDGYTFQSKLIGGKNRKPQLSWFKEFPSMTYSKKENGIFCVHCVLFVTGAVGKGQHQIPKSFVSKPFVNWKDFKEQANNHLKHAYHKDAIQIVSSFSSNFSSVVSKMDGQAKTAETNARKQLLSIIKCLKFCSTKRLPLRGTDDNQPFTMKDDPSEGVLRGLLKLIGPSDEGVKCLLDAPRNAQYISGTIQNEVIHIMAKEVLKQVVEDINSAKCFALLADETGTHSKEFLSICIRFVDQKTMQIREEFIGFYHAKEVTGEALASYLLQRLPALGIDMGKMVAQGYDGAANMCGKDKGVSTRIQKIYKAADYYHCPNHGLNLVMNKASEIIHIKNVIDMAKDCAVYFRAAVKTPVLAKHADILYKKRKDGLDANSRSKKKTIPKFCATRFVERHESILTMKELFPAVIDALEELVEARNDADAQKFLDYFYSADKAFALIVAEAVARPLKSLSEVLQQTTLELLSAFEYIENVKK
uniref:DUF4371 domain-containing protein n=1 Tax=Panagrolaimus superbus TaxID=310955 RepID=A0A914YF23_9BILA